ncbi:MAG TPA: M14 family zinc carboxypeptidase, partial [Pyrinomonadaceae bacterium]|nr:M14 family zinc carboxypeptidase [Pyrinomonadaceae bacterium]
MRSLRLCAILLALAAAAASQTIPAPKDVLGFTPGDDRKLASWSQVVDYFKKLDAASNRVTVQEIGKSTMGAPFIYATISSPENLRNLEKYKRINAKLADPRTFKSNDKVAQQLIKQGKTIVLITCGVHSTEVGSYLSSMIIAHQLAMAAHPDIQKILDNTIILLVPSLNPDGVDIVKNWYDKTLGTPYEGTEPPELYHKYVGHDDNRDWYAFTQVETQLTVDKIHNVWHPQIVHDIHQQGAYGSRLFLPPYMQPVEPNVPKQIVEGYTELGNYMASKMREIGYQGITTNSTYDAWTPSRAYSHYHGGVRILSETASAKLATPITVKFDELRPGEGYDPKKVTGNFGPIWLGGEWHLRNITDTMTTAASALMNHAANNREEWLSRFYQIGKDAVRPRKDGELFGFILPALTEENHKATFFVAEILGQAGIESDLVRPFTYDGKRYPNGTTVIPISQPYGQFAKALLENQKYPDLKDPSGSPISPYDVTAHTISSLSGIDATPISRKIRTTATRRLMGINDGSVACIVNEHSVEVYRSSVPSMDEGWTRWVLEATTDEGRNGYLDHCDTFGYESIQTVDIRENKIKARVRDSSSRPGGRPGAIIFPDQSPNQILNGYAKGTMPDEYTGGVGKEGVANLKKFVEAGGTLV